MRCREVTERTTEYLEGAMSPETCRDWEAHTAACADCARYVAQMAVTIRLLGQLGNYEAVVSRSRNS